MENLASELLLEVLREQGERLRTIKRKGEKMGLSPSDISTYEKGKVKRKTVAKPWSLVSLRGVRSN